MTNNEARPPTVFISYSHDSQEHADRVLALSDHLRADGIDCILDQYEDSPPEGFPRWMDRQIRDADYVIMICTPTYYRRVMGEEEPGTGHGVAWESTQIYQYIYNAGTLNTRFIPVLLEGAHESAIPTPWQGVKQYRPKTKDGYEDLYRRLTGQPLTPKPALGTLRKMQPRARTQDFVDATPDKRPLEVIENVPYARNPYFTGRENVLHDLHEALSRDSATALTQGYAISGLGGIGKTQTAVEYTYRYRSEYHFIFWTRADTEVALQAGCVEMAKLLDLPEKDATNPADTVQAVRHWLEHTGEWLLIFDNADTPEMLKVYYPRTPRGHILLTSRAQLFDTLGIARPLALETMQPDEALSFLYTRTARAQSDPAEKRAAEHLAAELGYLPLALEQAAAYITAKTARFQDYLASYLKQRLALLNEAQPKTGEYPASVAKTWALNFQEVEKDPVAADILRVSAFLSPDAIPLELLTDGASQLGPVLVGALATAEDPLALNKALEPLTRYSLIRRDVDAQTYSIHRMVQEVVKDQVGVKRQAQWAERVVRAVEQSFPEVNHLTWTRCERSIPHVLLCAAQMDHWNMTFPEARALLYQAGYYFYQRGQFWEAEPLWKNALAMCEQVLGPEDPDTLGYLNNLAELYRNQGKYEQAEPLYQRALETRERVLGPEHPDTLSSLNNLAGLYWNQGQYELAEPLIQRALETRERVLGPEHPDTARTLYNLANLYHVQGKDEQAEPLYQRALAIDEKVYGQDHPEVATDLNSLALLYADQGKDEQAEPLYQRALAIREQVFGSDHPLTTQVRENYAKLLEKMKQKTNAVSAKPKAPRKQGRK
jgi:tetratricopeptide (TPR) repeat protein